MDFKANQFADQWRLMHGGLAPGETVRLPVRSGSMLPCLPVGADIEIVPAAGPECRVGDVVVYRRGERLVAHRLLFGWGHAPGGWFLERGDGVSTAGVIRAGRILGKVVAVHLPTGEVRPLDGPERLRLARRSLARFLLSPLAAVVDRARRGRKARP